MIEQAVKIAAKLYEARDAMRSLWGDRYAARVAEYQPYIRACAANDYAGDEMKATMDLMSRLQKNVPDSGMEQALVLAAYVEMIEPSKPAP